MNKKLTAVFIDEDNRIVGSKYKCTDPDCNCLKSWTTGNPDQSVKTFVF